MFALRHPPLSPTTPSLANSSRDMWSGWSRGEMFAARDSGFVREKAVKHMHVQTNPDDLASGT